MSKITEHVGLRIRKCRKRKGYTIDEFSKMINKSKATLSKYENGSISIDLDTLYEISEALEMELAHLIDYKSPDFSKPASISGSYFSQSQLYMYYYDGRKKKMVRSVISLSENQSREHSADIVLYNGVSDFSSREQCDNIYNGTLDSFDATTHATLINQINRSERIHLLLMNPIHLGMPAVGIMTGIGNPPFFAPLSIKVVVSRYVLEEDEAFERIVNISKEELKKYRQYNMMIITTENYKTLNTK